MSERRVNVRGIIYKDGKLFAQRLKDSNGNGYDWWCTPGGGLDPNESLADGLRRELIEETGVEPIVGRLLFVQQFFNEQKQREELEFYFKIMNPDDYEDIDLAKTTHGQLEIAEYGFVDLAKEVVLPKILQTAEFSAALRSSHSDVLFHTELAQ